MNHILIWLIVSPIFLAAVTHFIKKYLVNFGFLIFLSVSIVNTCLSLLVFLESGSDILVYRVGNWSIYKGIILVADKMSLFFLLFMQIIFFFSLLFSKGYVKNDHGTFFSLFYLLQAGLTGMLLTGDLFNLYVFLEIVSIVAYALVAYDKTDHGLEAGFKYLVLGSVASLIILWGIGIIYATTGNLNLAIVAGLMQNMTPLIKGGVFIFFFIGFGIKFALFPFHPWLADAHASAPSPISALLSGVMIKIQLYSLIRIVTVLYGIDYIHDLKLNIVFMSLGVGSVLIGHLMALKQTNLKRMLAYSSIAHIGYIVIGLGSISPQGVVGAFYHMLNHGVLKIGLFYFAGTLIYHLNLKQIKDLKSLFWRNPFLSIMFCIFALGMIGIPPLNGFFSKWLIIMGVADAGYVIPAVIIAIGSFLSLIYYLRVVVIMFEPARKLEERFRIDPFFAIPIGAMVVCSILLVVFGSQIHLILHEIMLFIRDNSTYIQAVLYS